MIEADNVFMDQISMKIDLFQHLLTMKKQFSFEIISWVETG